MSRLHKTFICGLLLLSERPAMADEILGAWCDRMIPNLPEYESVLRIIELESGFVMHGLYGDGSKGEFELEKRADEEYWRKESRSGDRYIIDRATGDLLIADNEGLIRRATPVAINMDDC